MARRKKNYKKQFSVNEIENRNFEGDVSENKQEKDKSKDVKEANISKRSTSVVKNKGNINLNDTKLESVKTDPIISIVIPVYNAELYIDKCIKSVLSQSIRNLEVICVDDCSTDNSLSIIEEIKKFDERVIIIKNDKNENAGASRNKGISIARGKFIHFLDSDDWLESDNAYEELCDTMSVTNADICFFLYNKYDNITKQISTPMIFPFETNFVTSFSQRYTYFLKTTVVPWNKIYRTRFIIDNNILFDSLVCANDRTFFFKCVVNADTITFNKKAFINYRINNSDSLVGKARINHFDCHFDAFRNSMNVINNLGSDEKKLFLSISMMDLFGFFHKIDDPTDDMIRSFNNFINSISEEISIFSEKEIITYSWFAEYKLLLDLNEFDSKKFVPIVFATNNNYAVYAAVAMQSLIATAACHDKIYMIYVLHTDLSEKYINTITEMSTENVRITFINVLSKINSESSKLYERAHYSKEMYYRILISDIFRVYKKVLYLDCDIVILEDVVNLYNIDIGDNILGGITNISSDEMEKYITNVRHLQVHDYINSGILLINCTEFRRNYIKEKCFHLLSQFPNLVCPDQDILNMACQEKIFHIGMEWNFQWYSAIMIQGIDTIPTINCEIKAEYDKAQTEIKILHFTSGIKAWNSPSRKYANIFWEYAVNSKFYVEILCNNFSKIMTNSINTKEIADLNRKNSELQEKLNWHRIEHKRLTEENKSILFLLSKNVIEKENNLTSNTYNQQITALEEKEISQIQSIADEYLNELTAIRSSLSFKIGRFFTILPRWIRSIIKHKSM